MKSKGLKLSSKKNKGQVQAAKPQPQGSGFKPGEGKASRRSPVTKGEQTVIGTGEKPVAFHGAKDKPAKSTKPAASKGGKAPSGKRQCCDDCGCEIENGMCPVCSHEGIEKDTAIERYSKRKKKNC